MKTMTFKTNINCGGCKRSISAFFQQENRITKWDVDLASPEKILTVEAEGITEHEVAEIGRKAGYNFQQK